MVADGDTDKLLGLRVRFVGDPSGTPQNLERNLRKKLR